MKIGFVGLGIMGRPMAKNLLRAGHQLTVCDHHPEHVAEIAAAGARAAGTPCGAAEGSELVITMLPNSPNVWEAVCGENGVLEGAVEGTVLVDMSSIAPGASQEIAAACAEKGVRMLDAPVSGGEPKAFDGTLSIMAGGDREVFEAVKPVLLCMGASAVWCGEIGAGNTAKLANQVIVAANIAAASEAMMLARRTGVDPALVFDAIKGGLAGSAVLNAKVPMMLDHSFAPGFRIDLHIKDLGNALETGHAVGAPLPLTAAVMEMMQTLRAGGCGSDDHSALVKFYEKIAGETVA